MSTPTTAGSRTGPTGRAERITSLDAIRGVATLGILPMNALSFGLVGAAYLNVQADGTDTPLDWIIGLATMLFVDQKMMALFSLLFGVGIVIFADRAKIKGRRVRLLSLWRFALLLGIGLLHSLLWEGDILVLYAFCAPFVLALRRLPSRVLLTLGTALALAGTFAAPFVQDGLGPGGDGLGDLWFTDGSVESDAVFMWFVGNAVGRALGLMLIGVALHQLGVVQGDRGDAFYRRMATWGLGVGGAVTATGLVWRMVDGWSAEWAITGHTPTGLGTIPMALGYLALVILWNDRGGRFLVSVRNVGKMALTNYLAQSILGVVMLTRLARDIDLSRTAIAVWIVGVWALQLWWSTWWLDRFRSGPFEWAWRCATYRERAPLRR